jgi:hypothetical protein
VSGSPSAAITKEFMGYWTGVASNG